MKSLEPLAPISLTLLPGHPETLLATGPQTADSLSLTGWKP